MNKTLQATRFTTTLIKTDMFQSKKLIQYTPPKYLIFYLSNKHSNIFPNI